MAGAPPLPAYQPPFNATDPYPTSDSHSWVPCPYPGFPIWTRPTRPKIVETLAKRWIPSFTRRVRQDLAI
jgi:hypothetical protein